MKKVGYDIIYWILKEGVPSINRCKIFEPLFTYSCLPVSDTAKTCWLCPFKTFYPYSLCKYSANELSITNLKKLLIKLDPSIILKEKEDIVI